MDVFLVILFLIVIAFVVGFIIIIKIGKREKILCTFKGRSEISIKNEIIKKLNSNNYEITEKENGNIFVKKDFFTAVNLIIKQNGANVDLFYIHSNTTSFLIVFVILIFTFWILAIVLAIIADSNSKSFRENELINLLKTNDPLKGRICPSCKKDIPFDANICPYCGRRFVS